MYLLEKIFTPLPKLKNGVFFKILRVLGFLVMALLPLYSYLTIEFIHYSSLAKFLAFIQNRTAAVLFGISLVYLLYALVLLIVKKGWIATLILAIATVLVSMTNYFKFALVGDYLYPWDIVQQTGNVGELLTFLSSPFPWWAIVLYIGLVLALLIVVFSRVELPLSFLIRLPLILILLFGSTTAVDTPQKITKLLNNNTLYLEDMALQTSNYSANGFIGAFTVNLLSSSVTEPENYGKEAVDAVLSGYSKTPAGESFQNPDVILILSESFWDPTLLSGVEFSKDPLANYREITSRDGVISGKFYTTGFGGGTVRPEFETLTGLTTDYLPGGTVPYQYVIQPIESYISLYKELGYRTIAIHPYTSSFYLRKQGYPYIGIDELYFEDEIYALGREGELNVWVSGKQIADATFVEAVRYYMEQSTDDTFVFGISMENHQPYTNKFDRFDIEVSSDKLSEATLMEVKNFTQGVYEADLALGKLVDFIDSREKETVLVYFGDHLPTLGANYAAYTQSGEINLDAMNADMNHFLYSTPFLVYANFELLESEMLKVGNDNKIASYNLLNAVATLIDAPRSAYMHFLEDYYYAHPAYNVRLWSINKKPFENFVNAHKLITYDRTVGKKYSIK